MAMQCRGISVDGIVWRVYYTPDLAPVFATSSGSPKIPESHPYQRFDPSHIRVSLSNQPHRCFSSLEADVRKTVRKATPSPVVVRHYSNGYWV